MVAGLSKRLNREGADGAEYCGGSVVEGREASTAHCGSLRSAPCFAQRDIAAWVPGAPRPVFHTHLHSLRMRMPVMAWAASRASGRLGYGPCHLAWLMSWPEGRPLP